MILEAEPGISAQTIRNKPTAASRLWSRLLRNWQLYVLLVLPILYLILFKYIPMYGIQIAFKNFIATRGISGSEWVGLKQFTRFFHSYEFARILKNTILLSLYSLAVNFPFPIILALSLNYVKGKRFKSIAQMVTYAPHFISSVVMVGLILALLDPRTGLIGHGVNQIAGSSINIMGKPEWFKSIFVWSDIWQNVGFSCIIYLAALSGIDPALHEASVMDGASKLRRIWHIDLPGILPVAIIMLILNTGHVLDVGFEKVLLLQNPLNLRTSEVIDTYVYKVGLASQMVNYSYSSAIGLFKSAINLVLLVAVNQIARKTKQASLW
jgi:putative aldouronate transport system permease protein